ncbi:MAG TPA: ATP-binding protein [Thermoleophilia bacterium]|nr:ATP-binding protein [Thermoleophilia bacterium]
MSSALSLRLPLRRESARSLREALRPYLAAHSVPEKEARDIVLAAEEACINAIMHSGAIDSGFLVKARVVDHSVILDVSDEGRGFDHGACAFLPPADPLVEHGRGLFLIHELMDTAEVMPGPLAGGTTLHLVKRLPTFH